LGENIFANVEVRDAAAVTAHLRDTGLSPDTTVGAECEKLINGTLGIEPDFRAFVDAKVDAWVNDAEWQKKLFAGDAEATRHFHAAMAARVAPVVDKNENIG
jgi:hypothetical protein